MDYRSSGRTSSPRYGYKSPKKQDDFLHVLLFYIIPFIVFNGLLFFLLTTKPKVEITIGTTKDYKTTSAEISVKSFLPIKSMVSTQESAELPLEKTGRGTYTAAIDKNGVIEITVASINGMVAAAYEPVDILDELPPSINEDFTIEDNVLTFTIEDSQSGVDFNSISGTTAMGVSVTPEIDKSNSRISFEIDSTGLTVYADDMCGNATQANFNPASNDMTVSGETENQVSAESSAESQSQAESSEAVSKETSAASKTPGITINQ